MNPRVVVILGVVAVVLVFVIPPLGLLLGVLTLVQAIRLMRRTAPQPQELLTPTGEPVVVKVAQPGRINAIFGLVLGITATALGALLLILLAVFWTELKDYTDCANSTNTTQGAEKCKTELKDAVLNRVGQ